VRFDKAEPRILKTATYAAVAAIALGFTLVVARVFGFH
jgi:hypothetical protein